MVVMGLALGEADHEGYGGYGYGDAGGNARGEWLAKHQRADEYCCDWFKHSQH